MSPECEIIDFYNRADEDPDRLGCYVLSASKQLPTFPKRIVPPSSGSSNTRIFGLYGWEDGGSTVVLQVVNSLPVGKTKRARRVEPLRMRISDLKL